MIVEYNCAHIVVTTTNKYPDECPECLAGTSINVWHEQGCKCGLCRWLTG